jgi:hypothetical protein
MEQNHKAHSSHKKAPQFEITPSAKRILAKKDKQRTLGYDKSSASLRSGYSASMRSGRSKGTNASSSRRRPGGVSRPHHPSKRGLPGLGERGPTHSWATLQDDTGSIVFARQQMEALTVYDMAKKKSPQESLRGKEPQLPEQSRRQPYRAPRLVVSGRAARKVSVPRSEFTVTPSRKQHKVTLSIETVKIMLSDRKHSVNGATSDDTVESMGLEGSKADEEEAEAQKEEASNTLWFFGCVTPKVIDKDNTNMSPLNEKTLRNKSWLEYALKAIHEAKYGETEETPEKLNQKNPRAGVLPIETPSVAPTEDEEEEVEEEEEEDYNEDDRSISSVDLLVRYIGGCGDPDLSDAFPQTPRHKLALHEAARKARGYAKTSRPRNFRQLS